MLLADELYVYGSDPCLDTPRGIPVLTPLFVREIPHGLLAAADTAMLQRITLADDTPSRGPSIDIARLREELGAISS
ncbi:hypothetical protein MYSTI_02596 [Myxococcus stipitatus DSM 14675]|uniref:Uncharacterized protein n=1 Tax=Myxococcus stipitatus (strain DSM 14675 / JCM 12634 / Mx s8) TaxID=1278073 RepID=L7U8M8_MYXSD|nr:hypothetical protein MYSTI_02596 [Myxococcus stipitatus DSM 14675]